MPDGMCPRLTCTKGDALKLIVLALVLARLCGARLVVRILRPRLEMV